MRTRPLRSFAPAPLAFATLFALASPLHADEGAAKDEPPADPKVRVTAFALPSPGVPEARMVEVMRALDTGLKKNPRLEMKDLDTRLADFAQETPSDQIEAARTMAKEGTEALAGGRVPEAVQKLQEAVDGLAKVLPYIKKQELADAMAALAVAQYEGGDKKSGMEQFVELVTWRPDYSYDTQKFPAKFATQFDDAQRQVERAKKLPVTINTEPQGAQAYVDGKYIGVTPCATEPLAAGRHFVTLKKEGYRKAVQPVTVQKKGETKTEIPLERAQKYLAVEQARSKIEPTLGADQIDADQCETLRTVLFIDQAVFVKVVPEGDKLAVDTWLYDLRTKQKLSKQHDEVPAEGAEVALAPAATKLYKGVNYDGVLVAPEEKVPEREGKKPIYKTPWFWGGIAAGVVLIGGGVGTWYAVTQIQEPPCPSNFTCFRFGP